jgi:hypothetical protein
MRQTNLRRTADYRMSIGRTVYCGTLSCFMIFSPLRSKAAVSRFSNVFSGHSKAHGAALRQRSRATNPTHVRFWTCRFLGQRRPMRYRRFRLEEAALLLVRRLTVQTQPPCHNIAMHIIASIFGLIGPYDAATIRCCGCATSKTHPNCVNPSEGWLALAQYRAS